MKTRSAIISGGQEPLNEAYKLRRISMIMLTRTPCKLSKLNNIRKTGERRNRLILTPRNLPFLKQLSYPILRAI